MTITLKLTLPEARALLQAAESSPYARDRAACYRAQMKLELAVAAAKESKRTKREP